MPKKDTRSRGWCFTVQSWSEESCADVMSLYEEDSNCTYLIVGFEIAPRTDKKHLQCYIYYTNAISFSQMKKNLYGVHIEPQKSELNVKAYVYCMEGHDCCEFGERPRQGHRTDLEVIKFDLLDKKKSIKDISVEYFSQWCQYRRAFDEFQRIHNLIKYDTQFYLYDPKDHASIRLIYQMDVVNSYIIESEYQVPLVTIMHYYYSGKYKYIFYPNHKDIPEMISILEPNLLY